MATDPNLEVAPLPARVDQSHGMSWPEVIGVSCGRGSPPKMAIFMRKMMRKGTYVIIFKAHSFSEEINFRNLLQTTSMTLEVLQQDLRN